KPRLVSRTQQFLLPAKSGLPKYVYDNICIGNFIWGNSFNIFGTILRNFCIFPNMEKSSEANFLIQKVKQDEELWQKIQEEKAQLREQEEEERRRKEEEEERENHLKEEKVRQGRIGFILQSTMNVEITVISVDLLMQNLLQQIMARVTTGKEIHDQTSNFVVLKIFFVE
uniref:Uncharacterized protein n=1 Tax=Romanomermis culicivorax TaxID=13658 RepID=A0A915JNA4_ROMCU